MERESFIFYRSFYEAVADLNIEARCAIYDMICRFALYGEEPETNGTQKIIFTLIKPQLEANIKRADGAKKGGRPRKENSFQTDETIGFENKNHRFSENETDETIGFENKNHRFSENETDETIGFENKNHRFSENETDETIGFENKKPNYNDNDNDNYNHNHNHNHNGNDNVNPNQVNGKIAAADAATRTEDGVSANPIENSASPKKEEKGCGEKEERETVEERILKFRQKVSQIAQGQNYPADIVEDFCRYWLEMNEGGKKMRFETEKIFNHQMRLVTWINNEKKWEAQRKPASRPTTTAQSPTASNSVDDIWGVNNH